MNPLLPPGDMSTAEVAEMLGVTDRTVRRAIVRGELPADRRGASYRIARQDLARFAAGFCRPAAAATGGPHVEFAASGQRLASLPVPLSSFVGREGDREALVAVLLSPEARLVALTGPGGVGKTRLAIATAMSLGSSFPDGVAYVALAAVSQAELVVPAIADALGLQEMADRDLQSQVKAFVRERRMLLVLDNFGQFLAAAPEISRLAAESPGLTVLITSRAPCASAASASSRFLLWMSLVDGQLRTSFWPRTRASSLSLGRESISQRLSSTKHRPR